MFDPIPPLPAGRQIPLQDDPLSLGGIPQLAHLEPVKPPQEIADRAGEARRVAARLLAIIADHKACAARLGVVLDELALATVVSALLAESHRQDPRPILVQADEIRTYVLTTLFEELLEEPSNILHTTKVNDEVIRYEAMEVDFWRECLAALLKQLPN
jgi:hypothetical protein